jgi:hypothetical protein
MKVITRNGKRYFPQETTLIQQIEFLCYFQPTKSNVIYQVTRRDFDARAITAVNIEEPYNEEVFPYGRPVTPLKTF